MSSPDTSTPFSANLLLPTGSVVLSQADQMAYLNPTVAAIVNASRTNTAIQAELGQLIAAGKDLSQVPYSLNVVNGLPALATGGTEHNTAGTININYDPSQATSQNTVPLEVGLLGHETQHNILLTTPLRGDQTGTQILNAAAQAQQWQEYMWLEFKMEVAAQTTQAEVILAGGNLPANIFVLNKSSFPLFALEKNSKDSQGNPILDSSVTTTNLFINNSDPKNTGTAMDIKYWIDSYKADNPNAIVPTTSQVQQMLKQRVDKMHLQPQQPFLNMNPSIPNPANYIGTVAGYIAAGGGTALWVQQMLIFLQSIQSVQTTVTVTNVPLYDPVPDYETLVEIQNLANAEESIDPSGFFNSGTGTGGSGTMGSSAGGSGSSTGGTQSGSGSSATTSSPVYGNNNANNLVSSAIDSFSNAASAAAFDPLVIALPGSGNIQTTTIANGQSFDLTGSGFQEKVAWIQPGSGFLVFDPSGGPITNGSQMFGQATLLPNGTYATSGFQALQAYADGATVIDSSNPLFSQLMVLEANGTLVSLSDLGIESLNLNNFATDSVDASGNTQLALASYTMTDGTTGELADYALNRSTAISAADVTLPETTEVAALPDIAGFGAVYNLHQAMLRDTTGTLETLVEEFANTTDPTAQSAILDQLLYAWTGNENTDPTSRGPFLDAREVGVVEQFNGTTMPVTYLDSQSAVQLLEQSYVDIKEYAWAELMAQTQLSTLIGQIDVDMTSTTPLTLDTVTTTLEGELANNPSQGEYSGANGEIIPGEMDWSFRSKWNDYSSQLDWSFRCKWKADKMVAFNF